MLGQAYRAHRACSEFGVGELTTCSLYWSARQDDMLEVQLIAAQHVCTKVLHLVVVNTPQNVSGVLSQINHSGTCISQWTANDL